MTVPVSVMIFTLNEELNLPNCLDSLRWCDDVIVVDSFSRDATREIAERRGARFFQNEFKGFGVQRNWAMDHTRPKHDWVLIMDADERVTDELVAEMTQVLAGPVDGVGAFRIARRFHLWGRWLRHSSLYPTWVVRLVHKERVRYRNRGHAETQDVQGEIRSLGGDLIDENAKGVSDWLERQLRYARREAEFELEEQRDASEGSSSVFSADPLVRRAAMKRAARDLPGRAALYFLYAYFVRRGFMDGRDGLAFCTMRAVFEQLVVINRYDLKRRASAS